MAQLNDLLVMGQSTLLGPVSIQNTLSISGQTTLAGVLKLANGTWNHAGDDAYFGDNNTAGSFAIKGINGTTNLKMVQYNGTNAAGTLSWNGSTFSFSNAVSITGTLGVNSNTSIGGTLGVTGATTVSNSVSAAGFIATSGTDLQLRGPAAGASSDSGDIIFTDSTGAEISRLWSSSNTLMFRTRTDLTGAVGTTRYVAMANSSNVNGTSTTTYLRNDGTWATPPNTWQANTSSQNGYVTAGGSTNANKVWKCDSSGNPGWGDDSDTKVSVVARGVTKAYLLSTSTSPTTTAQAVTALAETGVYLDTTAARLTAGSFNATSDKRLKENLLAFIPQKSILDLPIYRYDFINGAKNQIGCMAQDLQIICPEIVNEDEDGILSIQESKIVYLLIDEIKKLKKELNHLKERK